MTLTVQDLSFAYGAKAALAVVGFDLPKGTFAALLGSNGAGKSTLFALLTRLFTVPKGRIAIAGHVLATHPLRALASLGVVFQQPTLDLDLTVTRNLRYFAALHGITGAEADARISAALDRMGVADRARDPVRILNGGHRRRVEIARALLARPAVLLLDEPTVGLDPASRKALVDHAHALAADGMTILWATHLTDEVAPDDRLLILHRGHLLADGVARDLTAGQTVNDLFLHLTGAAA